jgi:hypothetical protein
MKRRKGDDCGEQEIAIAVGKGRAENNSFGVDYEFQVKIIP